MKKEKLSPLEKIEKINKQIEKLKKQQQDVQKTFESKIINLLKKEKSFHHNFNTLYGAVLDGAQKLNKLDINHEQIKIWEESGKSALLKSSKNINA